MENLLFPLRFSELKIFLKNSKSQKHSKTNKNSRLLLNLKYSWHYTYGKFGFLVIIFMTQDISKVFKSSKGLRIPKGLEIAFESNIISALR